MTTAAAIAPENNNSTLAGKKGTDREVDRETEKRKTQRECEVK